MLDEVSPEHVCATCRHKHRIMLSQSGGKKIAVVWRCRELSKRRFKNVIVDPQGSCITQKSDVDYWSLTPEKDLVW